MRGYFDKTSDKNGKGLNYLFVFFLLFNFLFDKSLKRPKCCVPFSCCHWRRFFSAKVSVFFSMVGGSGVWPDLGSMLERFIDC